MMNASFVIPDTKKFKDDIMKIKPKQTHKFVKLDIAQFFLSGKLHELVHDATQSLTDNAKALTKRVLDLFMGAACVQQMASRKSFQNSQGHGNGAGPQWGGRRLHITTV
jgi:hypothetical protein